MTTLDEQNAHVDRDLAALLAWFSELDSAEMNDREKVEVADMQARVRSLGTAWTQRVRRERGLERVPGQRP